MGDASGKSNSRGDAEGIFTFLGYDFDYVGATAHFYYQGADGTEFHEAVEFWKPSRDYDYEVLERALFLAFILIGISYYKARPTREVILFDPLDEFQVQFFTTVYQEGLGQFAFENKLGREDLAEFKVAKNYVVPEEVKYRGRGRVMLQSGGKDSLLLATLLIEERKVFTPIYVSTNGKYPRVLDELGRKPQVITRRIDLEKLKRVKGLNGHVPVTYIVQTLAMIQAILDNKNEVITSIGQEGLEPNARIGDLEVNHQWSKTEQAEALYNKYVHRYIAKELTVKSLLREYTELEIAKMFAEKCWEKYGEKFSSCNVANYRQGEMKEKLEWCGKCAKCANSYLLFCPFVPAETQKKLFSGRDLFLDEDLTEIFQGLLGENGVMKPFECVGSVEELRLAYENKLPGYGIIGSNYG